LLRRSGLGDVAVVHHYFEGEPQSLRMHFRILEVFDAGVDDATTDDKAAV
jgi:hypothetical protein